MVLVGDEGGREICLLHFIKFVNRSLRLVVEYDIVARMLRSREPAELAVLFPCFFVGESTIRV